MRIALGQINPTIGDFAGNLHLIEEALLAAEGQSADLLILPELALCGYPPRDLLERPAFIDAGVAALATLARRVGARQTPKGGRTAVIVGYPEPSGGGRAGRRIANAAALIDAGKVVSVRHKSLLPTYDVFDERRYFEPASQVACVDFRGTRLGISICEDVWNDADFWPARLYRTDPIETLVTAGAELLVNISASPFTMEKRHLRPRMLATTARKWQRPLVFVNQVGGQDELVFDGASLVIGARGEIIARAPEFASDLVVVDMDGARAGGAVPPQISDEGAALQALVLGTRDYARRCGFSSALLGLSGGIDSALVACVAVRALGAKNVLGVAMPSRYSSQGSRADAQALAHNLGIELLDISIEPVFASYLESLAPHFAGRPADATEENLQARVRGGLLMALSNKLGRLLLTTGNKSELATGYCTLYGDMCGGLAVIGDVPKTLVYRLAREVNASGSPIPEATMTKPPSAELRPNQRDQDTLPPYEILDAILEAHLEQGKDGEALVAAGFERGIVEDTVRRVRGSEYKRRQAPPALKITGKAFGAGRRFPIAQSWNAG